MTDSEIRDVLVQRLQAVEARIQRACDRAKRDRNDVKLVAVTKTVGIEVARLLPELGVFDLGENRPQELWRKAEALSDLPVRWHMIGHLQRNKVERTFPLVERFHSADSERLLLELEKQASQHQRTMPVLIEVNASREGSKSGFGPEEVPALAGLFRRLPHLQIDGLMTMAAYTDNPEETRATFREVRQLLDRLQGFPLRHLSMGMSNDFEIAIEEGSTFVRIGTTLFDGL
jgi:pyridoxal phosphate enzyme (YggS family)